MASASASDRLCHQLWHWDGGHPQPRLSFSLSHFLTFSLSLFLSFPLSLCPSFSCSSLPSFLFFFSFSLNNLPLHQANWPGKHGLVEPAHCCTHRTHHSNNRQTDSRAAHLEVGFGEPSVQLAGTRAGGAKRPRCCERRRTPASPCETEARELRDSGHGGCSGGIPSPSKLAARVQPKHARPLGLRATDQETRP